MVDNSNEELAELFRKLEEDAGKIFCDNNDRISENAVSSVSSEYCQSDYRSIDSISAIAFVYRLSEIRSLLIKKVDNYIQKVDTEFDRLSPKQAYKTLMAEIELIGFEPDYNIIFGEETHIVYESPKNERIRILGTENIRLERELENAKTELKNVKKELESAKLELESLKRMSNVKEVKHMDEMKAGKKIAYKNNVTPENVRKYYYEHSKNVSDTAKHFKVSRNTIYTRLEEAGEKPRKKKQKT